MEQPSDPLFTSLTRREEIYGVPYKMAVLSSAGALIAFLLTDQFLVSFGAWLTFVTIGAAMHAYDQDLMEIIVHKVELFRKGASLNSFHWKARSYDP